MENSRATVLIAAGFAISAVLLFVLIGDAPREEEDEFQAYEPTEDSVEVGDAGAAVPAVTAMKRAGDDEDEPTRDVPRPAAKPDAVDDETEEIAPSEASAHPAVQGTEDTLNRPGPAPSQDGDEEQPTGSLDRETVRDGIKAVTPLVKVCYEETLEDFPDAAGTITVGFRIIGEQGEGRVEMSELDSENTTLFDEKLHDCMLRSIGEATFDAPEGGGAVNVTYPFNFDSGKSSDQQ
jgi:hypothetical protein